MRRKRPLAQIGKLLNAMILDTDQSTGLNINFEAANEDAKKILREAEAKIAEQKTKKELLEMSDGDSNINEKVPTQT